MPVRVPLFLAWIRFARHGLLQVHHNPSRIVHTFSYGPQFAAQLEPWSGTMRLVKLGVVGRTVVVVVETTPAF
jgi:hypothetical protein